MAIDATHNWPRNEPTKVSTSVKSASLMNAYEGHKGRKGHKDHKKRSCRGGIAILLLNVP